MAPQSASDSQSHPSKSRKSIVPNFQPKLPENRVFIEYEAENTGPELDLNYTDLRQTQVNGYIVDWVDSQQRRNTRDRHLWKVFIEDFGELTIKIFQLADKRARRDL
ncbi:hypothetical protein GcM3_036033 [Golovinomyces cichoracearum]|uniref:Uncharacterized protein n=1 Tax=Golovinomyces cichoracearum TaxID=62708 RepID=A0A420J3F9_9PEZI|nr:hypothetical protein GcM3_036033 [Golovinomyces cichoracearum]